MISKSYIWTMFTKNLVKKKPRSVNDEEKCDEKCCWDEQVMKEKNKDLFMIHMNEMVIMKPSSMAEKGNRKNKNDSPSFWSNYWSSMGSTVNLKRVGEYLKNHINKPRLLLKMAAVLVAVTLVGLIVSSSLQGHRHHHQLLINNRDFFNNTIENDSSGKLNNSELTADASSSTASSSLAISQTRNNLRFTSLASSILPSNVVTSQNEQKNQFNGDFLHKKSNVERINFYTTSNKNLYSVKVIPTLPSIKKKEMTTTSEVIPVQNYANECESTTLPLCQGKLTYDLTNSKLKRNLTQLEYQHFQHLVNSNCSNRVHTFVCHMLEPECRSKIKNIKPCRRVCKGIFESCSHIIASSEILTEFFDCNKFVDSNDFYQCEDITRKLKHCYDDEFQCQDYSCIPFKWKCDNIRDCAQGDDEDECKFCNYDEFKCLSDQQCISEKWHCDGVQDCSDGSDESDCDVSDGEESSHDVPLYDISQFDYKDYNDDPSLINNDDDKIVSTGDGIVPIFINPNSTIDDTNGDSVKQLLKRFRSTMRKINTLQASTTEIAKILEETSSSTIKRVTSFSTSHTSPCPADHLRCIDGLCITLNQVCDKIQDCTDNSDELHCEY